MGGEATLGDAFPQLFDATSAHSLDRHYFYQAAWAMDHIARRRPPHHHDVGSQDVFVAMLTAITEVTFIDLRPLGVALRSLEERPGTVLDLPMADRSVESLSCLHVAEHVGLGRYGDPLDPSGTAKAAHELTRVLAPGGELYFSLPIGRERVEFNAHRVSTVAGVRSMFAGLDLLDLAVVADDGRFIEGASWDGWDTQYYACGLFRFTRP